MNGFVCTWCALVFANRAALEHHWKKNRACLTNRNVSNPTQSKYGEAPKPGDFAAGRRGLLTLLKVERRDAEREAGIAHIPKAVQ